MKKYKKNIYNNNIRGTYVTDSKLNMRLGPDKTQQVITIIPKGQEVFCYGYHDGDWYHVKYNNLRGYCLKDWLVKKAKD